MRRALLSSLLAVLLAVLVVPAAGAFEFSLDLGRVFETGQTVARSFEDITPQQEYYIGRSVAAMVLQTYPPLDNAPANEYLNLLGQSLALASDRPETYGGYHFQLLDTDDITAYAAPDGLIFVSRGLVECCQTEDALAAVLAHEIGHVQLRHGLQAIEDSRMTDAFTAVGLTTAESVSGGDLGMLVDTFGDSVADVTKTMITAGYSRDAEEEADLVAVRILERMGYDQNALVAMLMQMEDRLDPNAGDFAATHPAPADRIAAIQEVIGPYSTVLPMPERQNRFVAATSGL